MDECRTVMYMPEPKKGNKPSLVVVERQNDNIYTVEMEDTMTLGRKTSKSVCNIMLNSEIVSRKHGQFTWVDDEMTHYYTDFNSLNGTYVNGKKLEKVNDRGTEAIKLSDGDIIRIDRTNMEKPHPEAVMMIYSVAFSKDDRWKKISVDGKDEIKIGREKECDIVINNIVVSRVHAILKKDSESWKIVDNDSMNGVYVNNVKVEKEIIINNYDVIRVAETIIIFDDDEFIYNVTKVKGENLQIDIKDRTVFQAFRKKVLIKNIKLTIDSGEMVLVLGGSGAGKSTFMNAVLGVRKANGRILLGGQDLYKNYEDLKYKIGFVPQFSLVRKNDDVFHAIYDAAKMRLPRDVTEEELEKRVYEVMDMLGIRPLEKNLCSNISGGQLKRVSVAVEAIANPSMFFLDEPDSGLDAGSNRTLMENLKEISNNNKIVMVITHAPNIAQDLFTKVFVLAKDSKQVGQIAFWGSVEEAKEFFNVPSLQDIVLEINSTSEGGKGRADEFINKFANERSRSI